MIAAPAEHAAVRFPPPLLYAAVVLAGSRLGRAWPVKFAGGALAPGRRTAGWVLVAGGAALCGAAVQQFRAAGTSPVPVRPTTALVAAGPYRFTRNPMYLGLSAGTAGVALITGNPWVLALLVPAVGVADAAFIRPEERYLERTFGDAYRAYRTRVRRWI